jgi:hypothetical protein
MLLLLLLPLLSPLLQWAAGKDYGCTPNTC